MSTQLEMFDVSGKDIFDLSGFWNDMPELIEEKYTVVEMSDVGFPIELFSFDNIRKQIPQLKMGQDEDVLKAEKKLFQDGHKGMLFTNATGTGKTYLGLGIVKRFIAMGKSHVLIITPTDKKCSDWVEEGKKLSIKMHQLANINEGYKGICTTTYANFYQNEEISKIHWDLIIYDESHYLQQNMKGTETVYMQKHRELSRLPSVIKQQLLADYDYLQTLDKHKIETIIKNYCASTKVIMLSATPFAYVKSLLLADGILWNVNETLEWKQDQGNQYNQPSPEEKFYIDNFGYRMRYNKLTIPESGVDLSLLEREFHEKWKAAGVISGRTIDIDKDYSRDFIILDSELGRKIDEGIAIFHTKDFQDNYPTLYNFISKKYTRMYEKKLLEALKAKLIIPRIKEHIRLGRKVVLFHDFNKGLPDHPFHFNVDDMLPPELMEYSVKLQSDIDRFNQEYKHLVNMDLFGLHNVIESMDEEFREKVVFYNGTISKGNRKKFYNEFMTDNSDVWIIVCQRKAAKEGVSFHDQTGVHERVFIDLGLPTAPTDAIQGEGRIFRVNLMSNARYEYGTIQTNFEMRTFASTIAERSRTAENLAMGHSARNMEIVFKEGYINSSDIPPTETTGTGGKQADRYMDDVSEFDKAKTYYYSKQKKTQRTKAQEGQDYYATPEPLGFKIVQWLDPQPNETMLEPSAGDGAIGRFFPGDTTNKFVEQSYELSSKLMINTTGEVYTMDFTNYSIHNKFNKIAMNPPFGFGGKDAAEHLEKCIVSHLKNDGRLIAIIPAGASMNKRLDEIFQIQSIRRRFILKRSIYLPPCCFERAGTNVYTRIIVVEPVTYGYHIQNYPAQDIDLSESKNIEDFFERIRDLSL